jgi:RimJ/RimL family protein N-acetyltransferase
MTTTPTLETERLILRPHRESDFADCLALWSDPRTVRFIGGQVQDAQAVWFRMLRYAGLWALKGFGYWVFTDRATGAYVGEGGVADFRRGIPLLGDVPETGWAMAPDAAGRGLAYEAMSAVLAWADGPRGLPVTRCIIAPDNAASLRLAAKLGYAGIGQAGEADNPLEVLERPAA